MNLVEVDEIFTFEQENKLIDDVPSLCECGNRFKLKTRNDSGDKYTWRCSVCMKTKSIRHGSFLDGFKYPIKKVLKLIYAWCMEHKIVANQQ